MTTKYGLQWLVAGRITAGRGFATFSNLEMQHSPKIFCIFLQKVLAKNIISLKKTGMKVVQKKDMYIITVNFVVMDTEKIFLLKGAVLIHGQ